MTDKQRTNPAFPGICWIYENGEHGGRRCSKVHGHDGPHGFSDEHRPPSACHHVYVDGAVACRLCGEWRYPKCTSCNGRGHHMGQASLAWTAPVVPSVEEHDEECLAAARSFALGTMGGPNVKRDIERLAARFSNFYQEGWEDAHRMANVKDTTCAGRPAVLDSNHGKQEGVGSEHPGERAQHGAGQPAPVAGSVGGPGEDVGGKRAVDGDAGRRHDPPGHVGEREGRGAAVAPAERGAPADLRAEGHRRIEQRTSDATFRSAVKRLRYLASRAKAHCPDDLAAALQDAILATQSESTAHKGTNG